MVRTLGVLVIAGSAIALVAMGGRIGVLDVTHLANLPLPLLICAAGSALLLLGLRSI